MVVYNLEESVGFLLNRTLRKFNNVLNLKFKEYDITTEQYVVLLRMDTGDQGVTPKDLACRTEKDQANITRILDQLERKGLIKRSANALDRRSLKIYLTDTGLFLRRQLMPVEDKVNSQALSGLTTDQVDLFKAVLNQITKNMTAENIE